MGLIDGAIAGAVQGIASIFDSGNQAQVARENTDKTIAANKQMAEYQYSKDLEMWNRGNVYNSPSSQMDRLKSAGLNPNLVYGSGGATTVAGQLPKYNAPTQEFNYQPPINLSGAVAGSLSQYTDMQIKSAQLDNLRAQRAAINQDTVNKQIQAQYMPEFLRERNFGQGMSNYWNNNLNQQKELGARIKNKWSQELAPHQLEYLTTRNKSLADNNALILANTENKKLQNEWYTTQMFGKMGLDILGKGLNLFKPGKISVPKVAPRVNPNNWNKFRHD